MKTAPMLLTDKGKPDTTARHVLAVLAEFAAADGTEARPSLRTIRFYSGYDERTLRRALRRLETGSLIEAVRMVNGTTEYKLALSQIRPASDWDAMEVEREKERAATAERVRKYRASRVTDTKSVTETGAESVTEDQEEGPVTDTESVRNGLSDRYNGDVTDSVSVCNGHSAPLTTNEPPVKEEPPQEPTLFGAADLPPVVLVHSARAAPPALTFDDFWDAYPKRRGKADAERAWDKAIKNGIDAARIIRGATSYAAERADEDPQYTKHPATWLNKGCWDDEPDAPPAPGSHLKVVGGWQPYQNPTDPNAYDGDL